MREKYGQERRTWVMDRGMVSEDNLDELREAGARTWWARPSRCCRQFERELLRGGLDDRSRRAVEVKLCAAPEARARPSSCAARRCARKKKRRCARARSRNWKRRWRSCRPRRWPTSGRCASRAGPSGAWGGCWAQYSRAAHLFEVRIEQAADPRSTSKKRLTDRGAHARRNLQDWAAQADGCYLLRTNLRARAPPNSGRPTSA